MAKFREPKEDDQHKIDLCFKLISEAVKSNPEIEGAIWVSACFSSIVQSFIDNGLSYEDYLHEMKSAMAHYKEWFDEANKHP